MTDKAEHDDYLEKVKALQDMDKAERARIDAVKATDAANALETP